MSMPRGDCRGDVFDRVSRVDPGLYAVSFPSQPKISIMHALHPYTSTLNFLAFLAFLSSNRRQVPMLVSPLPRYYRRVPSCLSFGHMRTSPQSQRHRIRSSASLGSLGEGRQRSIGLPRTPKHAIQRVFTHYHRSLTETVSATKRTQLHRKHAREMEQ